MTAPARPRESSPVTARPVTPVSILSASLEALYDELLAVDAVLADKLHGALVLARGLDPYLEQCTTPESPALQQLAERTRHHDWRDRPSGAVPLEQEMLSGHVEGQFLKMLVHAVQARRVLEIGMFTGYSALAMAEALPADGVVIACEVDDQVAAFASSFLAGTPAGRKVQVRRGPALRTLRQLAEVGETFDLVFIDADKAGYGDYLEALLDSPLLAPHTLVCVDNTLMQGQAYGAGDPSENGLSIARFNARVAADPRVEQVLLPLRDGVTLVRRAGGR